MLGDPPTTDCHAATSFASMHYLSPHYSLLIKIDPNDTSKVAPDVAQSWTQSDDKLTYTFKLRPGVTFHDGSKLTSADVKASFDRIRNPTRRRRLDPPVGLHAHRQYRGARSADRGIQAEDGIAGVSRDARQPLQLPLQRRAAGQGSELSRQRGDGQRPLPVRRARDRRAPGRASASTPTSTSRALTSMASRPSTRRRRVSPRPCAADR